MKTDLNIVLVGRGKALPSTAHLLLTLDIMQRALVLPYQHKRATASRKKMLDARRSESFNSLEDTPLAVTAAIQDEIAERVKSGADKFVSEAATAIAPVRHGFRPARRHRDTVNFKRNKVESDHAQILLQAQAANKLNEAASQ